MCMNGHEMKVWLDASSVAMGMALEVNGSSIVDASQLCLARDAEHIHLTEFNVTI